MSTEAEKRIRDLTRQLNAWADAYYDEDNPVVPDSVYDEALRELRELESKHPKLKQADSPTHRVGSKARAQFSKVAHKVPMLSLANVFSIEDLREFLERAARVLGQEEIPMPLMAEEKMDGLAISLHYKNGIFELGATRGDGSIGEDVSDNLKTIRDIPLELKGKGWPKEIEIRGEVYMEIRAFERLNEKLENEGKKIFANPRNASAGAVRLLISHITRIGFEGSREDIETLSLMGASKRWIFTPILIESCTMGILGSCLGLFITTMFLKYGLPPMSEILFGHLVPIENLSWSAFWKIFGLGVLASIMGAMLTWPLVSRTGRLS